MKFPIRRRGVRTWRDAVTGGPHHPAGQAVRIGDRHACRNQVQPVDHALCPLAEEEFSTASHMRVSTGPGATVVVPIGVAFSSMRSGRTKLDIPALVAQ